MTAHSHCGLIDPRRFVRFVGSGLVVAFGRGLRWMRFVGVVTAVALIGAACGSSESSDGAGPAARWQVSLTSASGQPLPLTKLQSGREVPALVVGGTYVASGTVPSALRSKLSGKTVELQRRAGANGEWKTVKEVKVGGDGRIRTEFTAGTGLMHVGDFRVAVLASRPSPTTEGAAGRDARFRLVSATRPALATSTTVTTSATTTAVGVVQFVVQVVNNTNNDLNLYIPTAQSNGTYNEGEVAVAARQTTSLLYTNPPPGAGVHFRATKQKCFLGCTNYVMNWRWYPTQSGTALPVPGYTACGTSMPQFFSNQVYKVELNDSMFANSNFAAGLLSGQLGGAGTGYKTCTFDLESSFVNWLQTNPVKGFLAAAAVTALIVAAVAVTVATAGAAAPLDAAVTELVADALVEVVANDAAADAAGDVIGAEVDATAGAVPESAGPDYFEFQDNGGYINPTGNGTVAGATANWFSGGEIISNFVFK